MFILVLFALKFLSCCLCVVLVYMGKLQRLLYLSFEFSHGISGSRSQDSATWGISVSMWWGFLIWVVAAERREGCEVIECSKTSVELGDVVYGGLSENKEKQKTSVCCVMWLKEIPSQNNIDLWNSKSAFRSFFFFFDTFYAALLYVCFQDLNSWKVFEFIHSTWPFIVILNDCGLCWCINRIVEYYKTNMLLLGQSSFLLLSSFEGYTC